MPSGGAGGSLVPPWPALSRAPGGLPLKGQRGSQIYEPASQHQRGRHRASSTALRPQ